jgi:hypothetical protein
MKTLTKLLAASAMAASVVAFANTANATIFVNDWTIAPNGEITVTFGDGGVDGLGSADATGTAGDHGTTFDHEYTPGSPAGSGAFSDTFNFFLPTGTVFNIASSTSTLDFTSITFNGVAGTVSNVPHAETAIVGGVSVTENGQQQLIVTGTGLSTSGWSGTATFDPAAVPEPATWALMIMGFGGAGALLRRRRTSVLAA